MSTAVSFRKKKGEIDFHRSKKDSPKESSYC